MKVPYTVYDSHIEVVFRGSHKASFADSEYGAVFFDQENLSRICIWLIEQTEKSLCLLGVESDARGQSE